MTVESIEAVLQSRLADFAPLKARIKFVLDDSNFIHVDATKFPTTLTRTDAEADCTLLMSSDNMQKLLDGQLNPTVAFTLGKLKVQGSMGLALRLSSILED